MTGRQFSCSTKDSRRFFFSLNQISRGLPVQRLAAIERQRVEVAVRRIRRIRLLASVYGALENWEAAASLAETVAKEAALLGEEGMQVRCNNESSYAPLVFV